MPSKTNHRSDIYNTDIAIQVHRKGACNRSTILILDRQVNMAYVNGEPCLSRESVQIMPQNRLFFSLTPKTVRSRQTQKTVKRTCKTHRCARQILKESKHKTEPSPSVH